MQSQSSDEKIEISLSQLLNDYARMPVEIQNRIASNWDPIERQCFIHRFPRPVANIILELYKYNCQSESFIELLNYLGVAPRGHSGECPHKKDHLLWKLKNECHYIRYDEVVLKCRTCLNDYLIYKHEFLSNIDKLTKIYHSQEIECDSAVHSFELHLGAWGKHYCSVVCKKCQKWFQIKKANFDPTLCYTV